MSTVAEQIAEQIEGFLGRRKLRLGISRETLARHIMQYIDVRRRGHPFDIVGPKTAPLKPEDWDDHAEQVWLDWFSNEVHLSDWLREVFRPVFGRDTCQYDYVCDGWREELLAFLPWWAQRTFNVVGKYDATPYESEDEEGTDPRAAKLDPYLVDHGSKQTRNRH